MEQLWAIKAVKYAETHFKVSVLDVWQDLDDVLMKQLIQSRDASSLRLTKYVCAI